MRMKFKSVISRLRTPPGVISWHYFKSKNHPAIHFHKEIFFFIPKGKNKVIYLFFLTLRVLAWWIYFGWRELYFVWRNRFRWKTVNSTVSGKRQLLDLLYLTFCNAIPPYYYYLFSLYKFPRINWYEFIYDHEVPHWQYLFSGNIHEADYQFINSKKEFTEKCSQHNIPVIPTTDFLKKKTLIRKENLFVEDSFFYKPNSSSGGVGCFSLVYDKNKNTHTYIGETDNCIIQKEEIILKKVNELFGKYNYLRQPLLENNLEMAYLSQTNKLTTLRVITTASSNKIQLISAILEIPDSVNKGKYLMIKVNIQNGAIDNQFLFDHLVDINIQNEKLLKILANKRIPKWELVVRTVENAHKICQSIYSIGWDLGFTEKGILLIEGNIGWGTSIHQLNAELQKNKILHSLVKIIYKK